MFVIAVTSYGIDVMTVEIIDVGEVAVVVLRSCLAIYSSIGIKNK
jgi:hypothetical protein